MTRENHYTLIKSEGQMSVNIKMQGLVYKATYISTDITEIPN